MKISLGKLNSRFKLAEERLHELEDSMMEVVQHKEKKKKTRVKQMSRGKGMCRTAPSTAIYVYNGVSGKKKNIRGNKDWKLPKFHK